VLGVLLNQVQFRIEEVEGSPTAVFIGEPQLRAFLLSRFLLPSATFVIDVLSDMVRLERGFDNSYAFENPEAYVEVFKDRVTIEPYIAETGEGVPQIELPIDEAKLLLFEWGAALQRWQMGRRRV
jgi:hypothetical protein